MSSAIFPLALSGTQVVPLDRLAINVASPSAQYGRGLFEGVMAYPSRDGGMNIIALRQHLDRMFSSAEQFFPKMTIPVTKEEAVNGIRRLVSENGIAEQVYIRPALLYPTARDLHSVPVGGGDALSFTAYVQKCSAFRKLDMACAVSPLRKPSHVAAQHKLCGLYAYLIVASDMATADGYDEAILLDENGLVAEGAYQNLIVEWNGCLLTPRPEGRPILPSITRRIVSRLLDVHLLATAPEICPADVTVDMLTEAKSIMLVGTASEVSYVTRLGVGGIDHVINGGEPTPLVTQAIDLYSHFVRGELGQQDLLVRV